MATKARANKKAAEHDHIEPRTARAAICALAVDAYAHPDGSGLFDVHSASGNVYQVDLRERSCTCADHRQREPAGGCYHRRRVQMMLGIDPVPEELLEERDGTLVANMKKFGSEPTVESRISIEDQAAAAATVEAIADGGKDKCENGQVGCPGPDAPTSELPCPECYGIVSAGEL